MSIQSLIDNASPGSIVDVPPGIYNEQIIIDKPLTLQGPVSGGTATLDALGLSSIPVIHILSDNVTVKRLTVTNGPLHGIQVGSAALVNLTNIVITDNNILINNNAGILTNHGASMTINNNTIKDNGFGSGFNRVGIVLYPHGVTNISENTIVHNATDGIFARGSDTGLIIENNVIENHTNSGITLAWDERNVSIIGNHIEKCGTGSVEEQGGIVIIQSMAEVIKGNVIKDCRHSGIFWGWMPTTGSPPTQILITGNRIKNSLRDAIYLFSQGPGGSIPPDIFPLEPLIKSNTLSDNGRAGVYVSNSYYFGPGNAKPTINDNIITGNQWGVFNATVQVVNAINNWWGSSSGPYHPLLNPDGTGDSVSDRVDFIPWMTERPVVKVIECMIENMELEYYSLTLIKGKKYKVSLYIKVTGVVYVSINGETVSLDFIKWFAERLVMKIPNPKTDSPIINYKAICCAMVLNDSIRVEIVLCTIVEIRGIRNISIQSLGSCAPRKFIGTSTLDLPTDFHNGGKENHTECIKAEVIFSTYRFRKTLVHYIDISELF